jgi:hypothetical protein
VKHMYRMALIHFFFRLEWPVTKWGWSRGGSCSPSEEEVHQKERQSSSRLGNLPGKLKLRSHSTSWAPRSSPVSNFSHLRSYIRSWIHFTFSVSFTVPSDKL